MTEPSDHRLRDQDRPVHPRVVRTRTDLVRSGWVLVVDGDAEARFWSAGLTPVPGNH